MYDTSSEEEEEEEEEEEKVEDRRLEGVPSLARHMGRVRLHLEEEGVARVRELWARGGARVEEGGRRSHAEVARGKLEAKKLMKGWPLGGRKRRWAGGPGEEEGRGEVEEQVGRRLRELTRRLEGADDEQVLVLVHLVMLAHVLLGDAGTL